MAVAIAKDLIGYCKERSIPFGFNIESVAIRKEEVEASACPVEHNKWTFEVQWVSPGKESDSHATR